MEAVDSIGINVILLMLCNPSAIGWSNTCITYKYMPHNMEGYTSC